VNVRYDFACRAAEDFDLGYADEDGHLPVLLSARDHAVVVIRILLELGADPTAVDPGKWTALYHAAFRGTAVVVLLHRWSPNGFTPVHFAAHSRHKDVVELLLQKGAFIIAETLTHLSPA
jgi:ankyrin repeat protein